MLGLILTSLSVKSQTIDTTKINQWFEDFAVCKCITYHFGTNNIELKDSSLSFWFAKLPLNYNNTEALNDFIYEYCSKLKGKNPITNCIKLKSNPLYMALVRRIIKSDLILKEFKYKLPKLE